MAKIKIKRTARYSWDIGGSRVVSRFPTSWSTIDESIAAARAEKREIRIPRTRRGPRGSNTKNQLHECSSVGRTRANLVTRGVTRAGGTRWLARDRGCENREGDEIDGYGRPGGWCDTGGATVVLCANRPASKRIRGENSQVEIKNCTFASKSEIYTVGWTGERTALCVPFPFFVLPPLRPPLRENGTTGKCNDFQWYFVSVRAISSRFPCVPRSTDRPFRGKGKHGKKRGKETNFPLVSVIWYSSLVPLDYFAHAKIHSSLYAL